jgi:hypothetical protein
MTSFRTFGPPTIAVFRALNAGKVDLEIHREISWVTNADGRVLPRPYCCRSKTLGDDQARHYRPLRQRRAEVRRGAVSRVADIS